MGRSFPASRLVAIAALVPVYSGGPAPDFHGIPCPAVIFLIQ